MIPSEFVCISCKKHEPFDSDQMNKTWFNLYTCVFQCLDCHTNKKQLDIDNYHRAMTVVGKK